MIALVKTIIYALIQNQYAKIKQQERVTVYQQNRLDELLNLRKEAAARKNVSEELVEKIFKLIHSESVNLQIKLNDKNE